MWNLDAATWTALGTWMLVVGTLVLMYWQTRTTQRLNSANAVMTLRQQFDSPRMLQARKTLSGHLLNHNEEEITIAEVATFFELVGTLTHRKVLHDHLVWEAFGSWASSYYYSLRHPIDRIGRARTALGDELVFHEWEWLCNRIEELDRKELGSHHAKVVESSEEAHAMMKVESRIVVA